jgi:hypothetical protein
VDLKQGDERGWSPTIDIQNWPVKICGLASMGAAVVGKGYIVELLRPLPLYHYTHTVAFEVHLK